jgi:hypothetical protein
MNFFDSILSNLSNNQAEQTVILQVNSEEVEVSATEAEGKTIAQLFSQFAAALGIDGDRPARYVDAGQQIPGTTKAKAGRVYSAAVTCESKG